MQTEILKLKQENNHMKEKIAKSEEETSTRCKELEEKNSHMEEQIENKLQPREK